MDKIFSGRCIDAVFHSASYGMSGREQVSIFISSLSAPEGASSEFAKALVSITT